MLRVSEIERVNAVEDIGLRCLRCEYNLTGLASDRCPECGTTIDWAVVRSDNDSRRKGTPAHHARGWGKVPATLQTILMMLFVPWRFAARLRADERFGPSLVTAVVSYLTFLVVQTVIDRGLPGAKDVLQMALTVATVILAQSLCLAALAGANGFPAARGRSRLRFWLIVSLYATCFVAAWPLTGEPPVLSSWNDANFYWPFDQRPGFFSSGPNLGVTIMVYWWWLILAVVLIVRARSRWHAAFGIVALPVFTWLGYVSVEVIEDLLDMLGW